MKVKNAIRSLSMFAPLMLLLAAPAFAQLTSSKASLSFPDSGNTANPFGPQFVLISTTDSTAVTIAASVSTASGGAWLTAAPVTNTTATFVQVAVNTSGLAAGFYQGTVTITAPGTSLAALNIPVQLTVGSGSSGGALTISPGTVNFSVSTGSTLPTSQSLTVSSAAPVTVSASAVSFTGGAWLSVSPMGAIGPSTSFTYSVTANPLGLASGTYTGQLSFAVSGGSTQTVAATLTVGSGGGGGALTINPNAVSLNAAVGSTSPVSQVLSVSSSSPVTLSATASSNTGGSWLSVNPAGPVGPSTTFSYVVYANPGGLAAGTYTGQVLFAISGGTTQTLSVTLTVGAGGGGGSLTINPGTVSLSSPVGSTIQASQLVTVSSQAAVTLSTAVTTNSGGSWLSVSPSGTLGPSTSFSYVVFANPTGLGNGTYTGQVAFTISGGATQTLGVTLTMGTGGGGGTLTINPGAVSLSAAAGSVTPVSQTIGVTSPSAVTLSTTATTNSGGSWLSVSPAGSVGPATSFGYVVYANPAGLTAATYTGQVLFNISGGGVQALGVTLTVGSGGGGGTLTINPGSLTFTAAAGSTTIVTQDVSVTAAAPVSVTATATTNAGSGWLSVTPGGLLGPSTAFSYIVYANPAGLAAGTYTGQVSFAVSGGSTQTLGVTFTVGTGGGGSLTISPSTVALTSPAGSTNLVSQLITVTSPTAVTLNTSASTTSGSSWLSVAPSGAVGPATSFSYLVYANPAGLSNGTYTGQVQFAISGGTTQTLNVTLTVGTGGGGGALTISPSTLPFSAAAGSTSILSQALTVSAPSAVTVTASAVTNSGGAWLTVSPAGTAGPSTSFSYTAYASPSGLAAGVYTGQINFAVSGGATQTVAVTLTIGSGGGGGGYSVNPNTLTFNVGQNGAVQSQVVTFTTPSATPFTVTTESPGNWLGTDTPFGTTAPTAPITITANPQGLNQGTYTGTVRIKVQNQPDTTVAVTMVVGSGGGGGTGGVSLNPSSLTFSYQPGGVTPADQTITVTTPAATTFSAFANVTSGGSWLSLLTVNGSTVVTGTGQHQANIAVRANPVGLPVGIYNGNITITLTGYLTQTVPVTLTVGNVATAAIEPGQLFYTYQSGGSNPPVRLLKLNTLNGNPSSFTATATTNGGGNWLTVTPVTGAAPGVVAVSVNPSGLAPSTYTGQVSVTFSGSSVPVSVPVTLAVSSTPVLRLNLASANFNYQILGSVPASQGQNIDVSSTGSALTYGVTTQVLSPPGGQWLGVSSASGTTPAQTQVTINANGLSAGTYTGTVFFAAPGQAPVALPVTLTVSSSPLINTAPPSMTFTSAAGTAPPASQNLQVSVTGSTLSVTPTAVVMSGGNWLSVSPAGASAIGTTASTLQVSVNPSGLSEGTYHGAVLLSSSGAGNNPVLVPVTYTVGSANATVTVTPQQLSFTQVQGGPAPPPQTLNIASSGGPVSFSLAAATSTGVGWLSVASTSGVTPGSTQVSVNASSLALGTYQGFIIVTATGAANPQQTIPVQVTVVTAPSITASPTTLTFNASTAGAQVAPQTITLSSSGTNLNYSAAATVNNFPSQWLTVTPTTGVTPATLSVSVNLAGLQPGTYTGNIQVNVGLTNPIVIPVTLNYRTVVPAAITAITNAASFLPTAVSPGMIVAIFGNNLGPQNIVTAQLTPAGTLATALSNVRVLFDGIPSPLVFVRSDVVAAVVPYAVAGRASVKAVVEYQGVQSPSVDVRVVDTAPAVFTTNQQGTGQAALYNNTDPVPNSANNPVSRGDNNYATLFITGEGQTSPAGIDGVIASANLLRRPLNNVRVLVGGVEATVIYAGSVPTVVLGEAQVSFFIPANAPVGAAVPVQVIVGQGASQSGVTMAIR